MPAFEIDLAFTPRCPTDPEPFTEASFTRRSIPKCLHTDEVALVLVDLWNYDWDAGPRMPGTGHPSYERGRSHAERKRRIVSEVIVPLVAAARRAGIRVVHANLRFILERYPEWLACTTPEERAPEGPPRAQSGATAADPRAWPPTEWVEAWRSEHRRQIWGMGTSWDAGARVANLSSDIPPPVQPQPGDLLACWREQMDRLLSRDGIRVLFYAGFEATECLQFKPYGMANMQDLGYLCCAIREATTTYEVAETLDGFWRTRCALVEIEARWGYTVAATDLLQAWSGPGPLTGL